MNEALTRNSSENSIASVDVRESQVYVRARIKIATLFQIEK